MSNTGIYEPSDSEPEGSRYNDSDEESLVDADSPADGYFERREHPQTTFVPNPATQERSEEDKAREAAAERRGQHQQVGTSGAQREKQQRERPPSHHSQPRSPVWGANENTPLLDAGPAGPPPDYAAATADRRNHHGREGSYGSLSDSAFSSDHPLVRNGLLNEQGVFGQRSEPQSMQDSASPPSSPHVREGTGLRGGGGSTEGGNEEQGDEERGFVRRQWGRDWNGRRRWMKRFKAKRLFTWLAVIGILLLILLVSGVFDDASGNAKYPTDGNGRNEPEKSPSSPDDGDGDDDGDGGADDPTKDSPMPPHRSTARCPYTTFSTPEKIGFHSPSNFSMYEFIESPVERDFFNDHITGTIQISAGPPEQEDAIVVWISVAVSGSMKIERVRRVTDSEGIQIMFPDLSGDIRKDDIASSGKGRWSGDEGNCLDFSLGVLVKADTRMEELEISTANFDVKIEHGVFDDAEWNDYDDASVGPAFEEMASTTITAVRGKVHAAYLSARKTYIETTSSSISGTFALRDVLDVKSKSGSIDINVDPKNASDEDPDHPADFHAKSNSGSIDVGYLTDSVGGEDIPERDYKTRVETSSASIKGSYILGSNAKFTSNSGSMDLSILPYFADQESTLRTSSGSAQTKLRLLSSYTTSSPYTSNPRAGILDHLTSSHKSVSGALHLTYPDEWEGVIDGETVSGSIHVGGEDVEVLVDEDLGKGIPGRHGKSLLHHVTARKGYGDSRLGFATTSGSVDVLVGRE